MTPFIQSKLAKLQAQYHDIKLYAVVDGLQYERHLGDEISYQDGVSPLFRQPEDAKIAFAGPWVFELSKLSKDVIDELITLEKSKPSLSWVFSQLDMFSLTNNLVDLLNVQLPGERFALFRFYDPRVLIQLKEILTKEQLAHFMDNIYDWTFYHDDHYHSVV
ncbi:DUF4123 domain-containing protein [Serratia silvae]|uniref:DUF4123 domain-containing protein n=1 Tax=Serratia silvae TaxID=2824122 RepID=A0ABT0KBL1_9GAMM|nr:DUF4123 domain-containing protein [Serratia silvae]MCL1029415.1 DUF4123 domain-containing protein [Serratia silvae]